MTENVDISKPTPSAAEVAPSASGKKRYDRPKLENYGSLLEMTTQLGVLGNPDGGAILTLIRTGVVT
jgi:hypothetical protein